MERLTNEEVFVIKIESLINLWKIHNKSKDEVEKSKIKMTLCDEYPKIIRMGGTVRTDKLIKDTETIVKD